MCPFLPDSPRLLMRKGKDEEAREILAALEGNDATPDSPSVKTQYAIIKGVLDTEYSVSYTWWELFTGKGPGGVVRRMILGAWMQAMNQISGINVTSYYMTVSNGPSCQVYSILTVLVCLHPRRWTLRTDGAYPCRCRISRLPSLFVLGLFRH